MGGKTIIKAILPLRLEWEPCYCVDREVKPGQRIGVTFSGRRYIAVVHATGVEGDLDSSKILPVDEYDTGLPPISAFELELWEFIASYYLCTIGEVYNAAYTHGKTRSESIAAHAAANAARRVSNEIASLERNLSHLKERLSKKEMLIESRKRSAKASQELTARLERQRDDIVSTMRDLEARIEAKKKAAHENAVATAPVTQTFTKPGKPGLLISPERIGQYADAAREALHSGRSVLILTPDIIRCKLVAEELRFCFPETLTCTSKETAAQRRRIADTARSGHPSLIIGTRSAIFLPFHRLGLVIIDEEQDTFYKQSEPAPRYNGRDCAVKLASIHGAEVILGSSCPSLESLLNVNSGRYSLRQADGAAPATKAAVIIDMGAERRKRGVSGYFSYKLIEAIRGCEGKVALIRGWEKVDELQQQICTLFPDKGIDCFRYQEIREKDLSSYALTAVLQADALVDDNDFRADERGIQITSQLLSRTSSLWVQTSAPSRFDGSRDISVLLKERHDFGFPPFTRMLEFRSRRDGSSTGRFFLKRDRTLQDQKSEIAAQVPKGSYIDVDPL